MLGYPKDMKGYRVWNIEKKQIQVTRNIRFIGDFFPFRNKEDALKLSSTSTQDSSDDEVLDFSDYAADNNDTSERSTLSQRPLASEPDQDKNRTLGEEDQGRNPDPGEAQLDADPALWEVDEEYHMNHEGAVTQENENTQEVPVEADSNKAGTSTKTTTEDIHIDTTTLYRNEPSSYYPSRIRRRKYVRCHFAESPRRVPNTPTKSRYPRKQRKLSRVHTLQNGRRLWRKYSTVFSKSNCNNPVIWVIAVALHSSRRVQYQ